MRKLAFYLAATVTFVATQSVQAHMYTQFPNYDRGGIYKPELDTALYKDGAFGPVRFNVQHTCENHPYNPTDTYMSKIVTNQVAIVIPTGRNLQVIDTSMALDKPWEFPMMPYKTLGSAAPDADGQDWGVDFVKPMTQASFPHVYNILGETSKGDMVPQAIIWTGSQPAGNDADLTATMEFPEIPATSCVQEVQYFFPSAQFCSGADTPADNVVAWLLAPISTMSDNMYGSNSYQWSPYLRVQRDLTKKPLPANCGGKGKTISVYPAQADIETYLNPVTVNKKDVATQKSVQWWINTHK